jgi:hypothetical protein
MRSAQSSNHPHPKPTLNRLIQYGALAVTIVLAVSAPLQVIIALAVPAGLFVCSAFVTLLLAAPVLMLTAYAPAVTVDADGLTLQPAIWRERFVPWQNVQAVKRYPLLPAEEAEVTRRIAVGRQNYRPAQGIMLLIPELPPQYRIAGFFAGERAAPVIALTTRAHSNYDALMQTVLERTDPAIHDPELTVL